MSAKPWSETRSSDNRKECLTVVNQYQRNGERKRLILNVKELAKGG